MGPAPTRRDFVRILVVGAPAIACGFGAPSRAFGQSSSGARTLITATPLSDNLIHFTGAGGNILVVTGPDGRVMVNGGREEMSADLLKAISDRTGGKRVQALINTDWHREHTGSNLA